MLPLFTGSVLNISMRICQLSSFERGQDMLLLNQIVSSVPERELDTSSMMPVGLLNSRIAV